MQISQQSIQRMLQMIKDTFPRRTGNGWKIPKFHEMLHLIYDIERYGSPANFNTAAPEHNHIWLAKRPGRHSVKDINTFNSQVGRCIAYQEVNSNTATGTGTTDQWHDVTVSIGHDLSQS